MKSNPLPTPDLTPEDHIRQIIAFSLCEIEVQDADLLSKWSSLDCVEAVVSAERALGIPEINDDRLTRCQTIGSLVRLIQSSIPKTESDAISA